ncbi:hypothetical protein ACLB2K_035404 [Fragaria x ananassa]
MTRWWCSSPQPRIQALPSSIIQALPPTDDNDVAMQYMKKRLTSYKTLMFNGETVQEDEAFKSNFGDKVGPPTFDNWRDAKAFCVFLKRFYVATLKLSSWKMITSNVLFMEMITLLCEINKAMISEDPIMKRVATSMKTKFDKYWGSFESTNKIIMIANLLDPRYKLQWSKMAMKRINASLATIQSVEEDLKKYIDEDVSRI